MEQNVPDRARTHKMYLIGRAHTKYRSNEYLCKINIVQARKHKSEVAPIAIKTTVKGQKEN
jgi:hypothetical protein